MAWSNDKIGAFDGTSTWRAQPNRETSCGVGYPVMPGTGVKILTEQDVSLPDQTLSYRRIYRSALFASPALGPGGWVSEWQRMLQFQDSDIASMPRVVARRADGEAVFFDPSSTTRTWKTAMGRDALQATFDASGGISSWQYAVASSGVVETYDPAGKLLSLRDRTGRTTTLGYDASNRLTKISGSSGRSLTLDYDAQGRVATLTGPDGAVTKYAYNATGMLTTVTWPDNKTRQYVYEDTRFPTALTGVIDEAGVRYTTYAYDDQGRAISSELSPISDRYQFQYLANGQTTVTQPSGTTSTYTFLKQNGVLLPTAVSAPCPTCGSTAQSTEYDANGNATRKVRYDGGAITYTRDIQGRETQRVENIGTADAKTFTTEWNSTLNLPSRLASPNRIDSFVYGDKGQMVASTWFETDDTNGGRGLVAPRVGAIHTSEWTYDNSGLTLSVMEKTDGVLAGSWVFTYDGQGNLSTLTNSAGKVAQALRYDGAGRLLEAVNTDGQHINLQYDARGRLIFYQRDNDTITYEYNANGFLTTVKGPGTYYLGYVYDAAHRLVGLLVPQDQVPTTTANPFSAATKGAGFAPSVDSRSQSLWTKLRGWWRAIVSFLVGDAHAQAVLIQIPVQGAISNNAQPLPHGSGDAADILEQGAGAKRDPVAALLSSLNRGANNIWNSIRSAVSSSADEDCDREQECQEGRNEDEALCATAKARYGSRGEGVCMTSAAKRYYECRRVGRANITIPLHGIETPL